MVGVANLRKARCNEASACSIASSGWPAQCLKQALTYQPRAKLGLRDSARSTRVLIAPMSSPKNASARAALTKTPGSSPATWRDRRAKSAPLRLSASKS
jgi:hypothetical protein